MFYQTEAISSHICKTPLDMLTYEPFGGAWEWQKNITFISIPLWTVLATSGYTNTFVADLLIKWQSHHFPLNLVNIMTPKP